MRTAFITGASRGIGFAIADRFRRAGFQVIAPSSRELDLANPGAVERFFQVQRIDLKGDIFVIDPQFFESGIVHGGR